MLVSLFSVSLSLCCLLPLALSSTSAPLLAYLDDSYKPSLPLLPVLSTAKSVQFGPLKRQPQLFDPEDLSTPPTHSSIILATPSLPSQLSGTDLIEHVRRGGNLMIILTGTGGESYREVLKNFGVEPLPGRFQTFSDDHRLSLNKKHALSASFPSPQSAPKHLFGFHLHTDPFKEASFNPLLHPLLSLSPHQGFCASGEEVCSSTGAAIATLESRTGGRVVLVGAPELASPELFEWMQGTIGKIAVESFELALVQGEAKNRGLSELKSTIYRVGDHISLKLCMRDSNGNPFSPINDDDLQYFQAELRLMTIHARLPFQSSSDGCLLIPSLKLPSIPGIYTLRFHLRRPGWSLIGVEEKLLVRPFRHDEYERFLGVAGPYYGSWWSLMVGLMVLIPFLLSKALRSSEKSIEDEKKKNQ